MYAITVFTDTFNGGVNSSVSFYGDKESALDSFASLVQQEFFFLDEEPLYEEFIENYAQSHYSFPVNALVIKNESLRLGTYPEGMIVAEYFDGVGETYRVQMVECIHHLSITI